MPKITIIMGSKSDLPVVEKATAVLRKLGLDYDVHVASAHRTPGKVETVVRESSADVFIAVAGLSAALPGVVASMTLRPVIGVPVSGKLGIDAILSVVQMPPGIPVASVGLDRGDNAAVLAAQIIALSDAAVESKLEDHRKGMASQIEKDSEEVRRNV